MIKEIEEKQFGENPQECFEEGLPDKNGNFYFEALITDSIYCAPDKYTPHTYFNICKFETNNPIPNLNYDKRFGKMFGKLLGKTIELLPMRRYKVQAVPKHNDQYNEWQYEIVRIWELEATSDDEFNAYLRFFATEKGYNTIVQEDPSFVKKVLDDENYKPERFKGMQQRSLDKLVNELRDYKDCMPLIAKFSQFPEISLSAITSMEGLSSNPKQTFDMIKDNPYLLTKLPRLWMEKGR